MPHGGFLFGYIRMKGTEDKDVSRVLFGTQKVLRDKGTVLVLVQVFRSVKGCLFTG